MSGDPERLLDVGSGAGPLERELLGSVRHVAPPADAKDIAWRGIAAQIAVVGAVGAATSSTAAAAGKVGGGALSTKLAMVALTSGLALGGGYLALRSPDGTTKAAPQTSGAPVLPAAPSVALVVPPAPVTVLESEPAEQTPPRKLERPRLDALKAESAGLMAARAQLRAGNAAAAQASLDRLQAQFPKGMLAQEREVLAIEVLYARGNVSGAKRRAQAFIKTYPKSPHSQKLARFVD